VLDFQQIFKHIILHHLIIDLLNLFTYLNPKLIRSQNISSLANGDAHGVTHEQLNFMLGKINWNNLGLKLDVECSVKQINHSKISIKINMKFNSDYSDQKWSISIPNFCRTWYSLNLSKEILGGKSVCCDVRFRK